MAERKFSNPTFVPFTGTKAEQQKKALERMHQLSHDPRFLKGQTVIVDCDGWGEISWETTKRGKKDETFYAIGLCYQSAVANDDNCITISSFKETSRVDVNGEDIQFSPNGWDTDAMVFEHYTPRKGDVLTYAVMTIIAPWGKSFRMGRWVPTKINDVEQTDTIKELKENGWI